MSSVRRRTVVAMHLTRLDHLGKEGKMTYFEPLQQSIKRKFNEYVGNLWLQGIGASIHNVDSIAAQARDDQPVPRSRRVIVAAGTGIPTCVVDLITDMKHRQSMQNLSKSHFMPLW